MGERRPPGEREYNPLDDSLDIISRVVSGTPPPEPPLLQKQTQPIRSRSGSQTTNPRQVVKQKGKAEVGTRPTPVSAEFVICKFKVPKSEYVNVRRILHELQDELGARIDLANLGRGWLTRLITAEKELLDAARQQEKLKTPNPRNPLELADIDHAMALIQSIAFRRADPIK